MCVLIYKYGIVEEGFENGEMSYVHVADIYMKRISIRVWVYKN